MDILFVCSGNTCRSPMAEGYLNSKNISGLTAKSCGFMGAGEPATPEAVAAMREIDIDISAHRSATVSRELIAADKIYCMGDSHRQALIAAGVENDKVFVLGGGISDPFGHGIAVYRICRDQIINAINCALYGGMILPFGVIPASGEDAEDIAAIEKESFSSPWSENAVREAMEHKTVFFKAVSGDRAVGHIGVTAVAGEGYINNLAVLPDFKRQGVGSLLLDRAITFSRESRLEFLSLEVRKSNEAAIALYKKLGFETAGERKDFYDDPKENGIIMTRWFCYADPIN
ncbi:MAG: ribosomal protein S18-alanine N-acetyltransferase [Clostridia bacterium]|nr:ribosomal protein S18-alanine N-acetyltransferase [Clostridia bacterium]